MDVACCRGVTAASSPSRTTDIMPCTLSTVPCLVAYRVPCIANVCFVTELSDHTCYHRLSPKTMSGGKDIYIVLLLEMLHTVFTTQVFDVPTISCREDGARVRMQQFPLL